MRAYGGKWVFTTFLVLVPAMEYAQAAITGVVRKTSGVVLPGVPVEASSPAMIEKVRSAVTHGNGHYRIVQLRPGAYTMTFALTTTIKRDDIRFSGSFTATVSGETRVGVLEEET